MAIHNYLLILLSLALPPLTGTAQSAMNTDFIRLSQDFLYAARTGELTQPYMDTIARAGEEELSRQLGNDGLKKAFFINLYNAYTQFLLKKDPDQYKSRNAFFSRKQIDFAGRRISLDRIEHGFLRRSAVKWSLGHFSKLFPGKLEKKFRIHRVDYRIHFTLNCGAKSCPAIAYYKPEELEAELDLATRTYLTGEAEYDSVTHILRLPALMSWFRGDFGGKRGERRICAGLGIIPAGIHPRIKYKRYNWALYLDNYKNE